MIIAVMGLEDSVHINRVLTWLVGRGHKVHMISRKTTKISGVYYHNIDEIRDNRPRIRRLLTGSINTYKLPFFRINQLFGFKQLLKSINAQILYSYTLFNHYPGYMGLFSNFHPYVITPLNGDLLWEPKKKNQGILTFQQRYYIKRAVRKGDHLTASSLAMKDSWLKHGAIPSKITMVIDPGTDTNLFRPRKNTNRLKEELGFTNCPVVLSPRSLVGYSNIDIIIKSIPKVLKKIPNTKFVFIWHAADENELRSTKELMDKLNISHAVRLVGKVEDYTQVPIYFNISDVFVSLSSCDSTPDTLLEAMACGVAPVCADLPPIKEWIENGENGFIVPQRDPDATALRILELLENPSLRTRFATKNLHKVRKEAEFEKQMIKLEYIFSNLIV